MKGMFFSELSEAQTHRPGFGSSARTEASHPGPIPDRKNARRRQRVDEAAHRVVGPRSGVDESQRARDRSRLQVMTCQLESTLNLSVASVSHVAQFVMNARDKRYTI